MQTKSLQYTKQQLLESFKKKQNDKIRELIMQETGVDLFTELPQEAVNKQQDQLELNLNQGFFKNKKVFGNKSNNNNTNFSRGDNNKSNNDFKRGPLNNKNQESGGFGRKNQGGQQTSQQQQGLKELIPVFQECGFIKDPTIEVWYYKESEEIEGPFNSVDMDNMLFANKVNFETKVAFKDPEEKYVRIKKIIQLTYEDKYNHLFVQQKTSNTDENANQRRNYYKKEFTGSNEENTNFSRGAPRFTKQTSDNNSNNNNTNQQTSAISRPQFTRNISDTKSPNVPTENPQVSVKQPEQKEVPKQQEPVKNSVEQKQLTVTSTKEVKEAQKTQAVKQPSNSTKDEKLELNQEQQKTVQEEKQTKPPKENKKQNKETKEQKQEPKQVVKTQTESTTVATNTTTTTTTTKQANLVQLPVQQEQNLEGFQVIPSKQATKKKFDKKNATKILVTGLSDKEIQEEENRKRLEEIRQRDLIQQQKFAEQQAKVKEQEQPQKKIDYFDSEQKAEEIIGEQQNFPTLGQPASTQKKNQLTTNNKNQLSKVQNSSDDDDEEEESNKKSQTKQAPPQKAGNKLVKGGQVQNKGDKKQASKQQQDDDWIVNDKNSKKKQSKRTQEESDEEYERQQAIINEQARQERLRKLKEQEEKQRQLELQQQEERRKIEEFQRRQQFGDQDYHSESEEEIDPSDEKSFPTLGGQVYNGPPKKNQSQQNKAKGKFSTSAQSKALFNYVKTLEENAWDIQPQKQPIKQPQQSKPKQSHINNDDFPSL